VSVKAGKITLPAAGPFSVTDVGFQPQLVFFVWADATVEDSWTTSGFINGGMGVAGLSGDGGTIINSQAAESWGGGGNTMSSTYLTENVAWARSSHSGGGWAFKVTSFNSDGFTMDYAEGFSSGATGKIVYYCALADLAHVGHKYFWHGSGGQSKDFGWPPDVYLMCGSGGESPPSAENSQWNFTASDYCGWGMGFFTTEGRDFNMSQANQTSQPTNGGWISGANPLLVEDSVAGLLVYDSLSYALSGNTLSCGVDADSGALLSTHVLSGVDGDRGSVTPSSSVDGTVAVTHPVDGPGADLSPPQVVIFHCPQEPANDDGSDTKGGRAIGFVTPDFQCVAAWGGDEGTQTARFISSNRAWVSNFVSPSMGASDSSAGQAALDANGFTLTTKENGKTMQGLNWLALGAIPGGAVTRHLLPILGVGS